MTTETLEAKRDRLRGVINEKSQREQAVAELVEVERQIAAQASAALTADASKRLLAIKRAVGSLVDQAKQDEARLVAAARDLEQAAIDHFARREKVAKLRHEAKEIADVFGLKVPELPLAPR